MLLNKVIAAVVTFVSLLCLLPNSQAVADWPTAGANPQRTSRSDDEIKGQLKLDWYKPIEPYISRKVQIIAACDTLYLSTSRGLYALDPKTGKTRWVYNTDLPLGHSPTVANGRLYVGGFDKMIHCLDAHTGRRIWTFRAEAGFGTNPLVVDSAVYAGSHDGFFYALDVDTGKLLWKFRTDGPIRFSAAYSQNRVFFASQDAHAYALDADTGRLLWKSRKLAGAGFVSYWPVIYKNRVIFAGTNNYRKGVEPGKMPSPVGNMWSAERKIMPRKTKWGKALGVTGMKGPLIGKRLADGRVDVSNVIDFFKERPWLRTFYVLDQKTGEEKEIAPFFFAADDGACNRYPPVVGSDGLLYANTKLTWNPHWMRGHISGWHFPEPFINTPSTYHKACDEPLAWSAAGDVIYWDHCSHRSAGAFDISVPNRHFIELENQELPKWKGQPPFFNPAHQREWIYFDYSAVNRIPEVVTNKGRFAYGYHGDQNPPIPYKNRVYWHVRNGVIAFSPDGQWPEPFEQDVSAEDLRPVTAKPLSAENKLVGLTTHIQIPTNDWPALIQQRSYTAPTQAAADYYSLLRLSLSEHEPPDGLSVDENNPQTLTASSGDRKLSLTLPVHTPAVLASTDARSLYLKARFAGAAFVAPTPETLSPGQSVRGAQMKQSWLLMWYPREYHPNLTKQQSHSPLERYVGKELPEWTAAPVLLSLQHRPKKVSLTAEHLKLEFAASAGSIVIFPLFGLQDYLKYEPWDWHESVPDAVVQRAERFNRIAKCLPRGVEKNRSINENGSVTFKYNYRFTEIADDWGTEPLRLAPLEPRLALAIWRAPVETNTDIMDLNYPLPLGRYAAAKNTDSVSVTLPYIRNVWNDTHKPDCAATSADDPLVQKLNSEVRKMIDAGHLRPGWKSSGQFDNQIFEFALCDYFHNPADTISTLIQALPFVSESVRPRLREYIKSEFENYPPYEYNHVGWDTGASRDVFSLPPEAQNDLKNYPPTVWRGCGMLPHNLYACYLYAKTFGGADDIFSKSKDILSPAHFTHYMPYLLNLHIAGRIGYLKLARLADVPQAELWDVKNQLIDLLLLRVALCKSGDYLADAGFEYGRYDWTVNRFVPEKGQISYKRVVQGRRLPDSRTVYGRYQFTIDFVNLVPELGDFLNLYAREEVSGAVETHNRLAPYWFVPWAEEFAGEGTIAPLYDVPALFAAKAMILKQSRPHLERYLDAPAFARGDLFYIRNLTAALNAPVSTYQQPK